MEAAGYQNPCMPDKEAVIIGGDVDTMDMKTLFGLMYEAHPESYVRKSDIVEVIRESGADIFVWMDWDGNKRSDITKFGVLLSKYIDRILGGIRLRCNDRSARGSRQLFIFTKKAQTILQECGNHSNVGNVPLSIHEKTNSNIVYSVGRGDVAKVAEVASEDLVDERSLEERVLAELPGRGGVKISSLVEQFGAGVIPAIERLREKGAVYEPEVGVLRRGL